MESILETIGNTPLVRVRHCAPANGAELWLKLEYRNPTGSMKDRMALAMVEGAERDGLISPGDTVVEYTGGSTGPALALVCRAKGYRALIVIADCFTEERMQLMRALGGKVILTPAAEKASGAIRRSEELVKKHGWFMPQQFENPSNPAYHRNTTGPEILRDFVGKRLDYFVSGIGTAERRARV